MDGASDEVHSNPPAGFSDESGDSDMSVRRSARQKKK